VQVPGFEGHGAPAGFNQRANQASISSRICGV
jgi:hypothetical protein